MIVMAKLFTLRFMS